MATTNRPGDVTQMVKDRWMVALATVALYVVAFWGLFAARPGS